MIRNELEEQIKNKIVVEDNHGDYLRYSVSKDVYKQIDIGEMYRRK